MAKISETVYVNGGEVYRQTSPTSPDTGVLNPEGTTFFPFIREDGKAYYSTNAFAQIHGESGQTDLEGLDLCPDVHLWACFGALSLTETDNYDIYFIVESSDQLQQVAEYYGVANPANDTLNQIIDNDPKSIMFWRVADVNAIFAAIKYVDGSPSLFKLYVNNKDYGVWDVWMTGTVYHNGGSVFELGASYIQDTGDDEIAGVNMRHKSPRRRAELIYAKRESTDVLYEFYPSQDPLFNWKAKEVDEKANVLREVFFESSRQVREVLFKLTTGSNYSDKDLSPDVSIWIGKAYSKSDEVEELFYAVTNGSAQIEAVSSYYGLPSPLNSELAATIDTNPESIRARHYDLLGQGNGFWLPVVVGSIKFNSGKPVDSFLYAFKRPWEHQNDLPSPDPRPMLEILANA